MSNLKKLLKIGQRSHANVLVILVKHLFYKLNGKNIIALQNTSIRGLQNIVTKGVLRVGEDIGFTNKKDHTYINISGKLNIEGSVQLRRGCRLQVGEGGTATFGNGTFVNAFTRFIINHNLVVGENCAISWDCQFLDEDFHQLHYEGKKNVTSNDIRIGNKVWLGQKVTVFKGTVIPDGCVVAANSVVKGIFTEENTLIAGNPAKVIKHNVSWED